ncbi:hypothetical protein [Rhodococcus tukisamuensis]|uniref:Uncharacterized protein n=1 Tax=Rhodococcus tukisamuensis TaxID=168276 RepID=A0A1G6TBC6_9NOCA|nr:hypothetical protein [Rhodococcus tukisamuensis]SDD26154.1 hypothetical protein SAMN05444580_103457 [Rhodococcus tukisamuensis]
MTLVDSSPSGFPLEAWWHTLATFGMDGHLDFNATLREQFNVPGT